MTAGYTTIAGLSAFVTEVDAIGTVQLERGDGTVLAKYQVALDHNLEVTFDRPIIVRKDEGWVLRCVNATAHLRWGWREELPEAAT